MCSDFSCSSILFPFLSPFSLLFFFLFLFSYFLEKGGFNVVQRFVAPSPEQQERSRLTSISRAAVAGVDGAESTNSN